jgi:hypothetical protein
MPRRARLDAPGTLHHVIVRGIEKRRIVDDDNDRESFIQRLGELSQRSETAVHAWSLMTNPYPVAQWSAGPFCSHAQAVDRLCRGLQPPAPAARPSFPESVQIHRCG